MPKRLTLKNFIERANIVHECGYDYSKVDYIDNRTKVCIICPAHGEFWQTSSNHLQGYGCPECAKNIKLTNEKFAVKASAVHEGKYDYSKVTYKNSRTKVCIICPIHGEFWQTPSNHLQGYGCPECKKKTISRLKSSYTERFAEKARNVHKGKRYDYSKVTYKNSRTKVCIICPIHGEFWQKPNYHLMGHGCPECGGSKKHTYVSFVRNASRKHNGKYDYSETEYAGYETKVCIICPIHGKFWKTPHAHLRGEGCPKCNMSRLEKETDRMLEEYSITHEAQKRFVWLVSPKNRKMSLDFYLPHYNIAIECQGIQHYKSHGIFTEKRVSEIKRMDGLKNELCAKHGVSVYYIKYDDDIRKRLQDLFRMLDI